MNAFILLLPLLVIRFILLGILNREVVSNAAYFAPLLENEKWAYYLYQLANIGLIIGPLFLRVNLGSNLAIIGIGSYLMGIALVLISTIDFALPKTQSLKAHGLYRFSRNPMYVGYFFYFLGCVCLTQSLGMLISLMIFQVTAHWIILAEERWCLGRFGEEYKQYQQQVSRYLSWPANLKKEYKAD